MKYADLKSFIEEKHFNILKKAIDDYLKNNNIKKVFSVDSIHIETLNCKEKLENFDYSAYGILAAFMNLSYERVIIVMNVGISCVVFDINDSSKIDTRFFTANLKGDINNWYDSVKVYDVEETAIEKFVEGDIFNQFLLPDIDNNSLEIWADKITSSYIKNALYDGYSLPVHSIIWQLKMDIFEADLPENCLGRMYFRKSKATIYDRGDPRFPISKSENADIKPGTMLINKEMNFLGGESSQILTIAHEISHWYLHKNLFKLLELLDSDIEMFSCEEVPPQWNDKMDNFQKAHWYAEWQANELAIKIAMPRALVEEALQEAYKTSEETYKSKGEIIQETLGKISDLFSVPVWVGKQRLRQLEYDIFDGVHLNIDEAEYQPIYFTPGTLKANQTFIINRSDYDKIYNNNPNFAELIDNNKYIYLGHVVCMKKTKYIDLKNIAGKYCLMLSDYASEHADKCCIIFNLKSAADLKQPYEFYGQAYFNNNADSSRFTEYKYDSSYKHKQSDEEREKETQKSLKAMKEIRAIYNAFETDKYSSFALKLFYHMKRKNITVDNLSERSKLSVTTIEKYRTKKVKKIPIENVMAICIGLNLPELLCRQMIKTSGNALTNDDEGLAYELLLKGHTGKGENIDHWNEILSDLNIAPIPNKRGNVKK